jgi:hypothetical protein
MYGRLAVLALLLASGLHSPCNLLPWMKGG